MASKKKEIILQDRHHIKRIVQEICLESLSVLRAKAVGELGKRATPVTINNQELWEEMLGFKGLIVVDVYQGWCGPCRTVVNLFRKIRNELGDDLLHFAVAEVDSIDALENYRGKCEPTFLFYAGGELVAVVRGANAPRLQKTILDQLEAERKVLEQGAERVVIKDEALSKEREDATIIQAEE